MDHALVNRSNRCRLESLLGESFEGRPVDVADIVFQQEVPVLCHTDHVEGVSHTLSASLVSWVWKKWLHRLSQPRGPSRPSNIGNDNLCKRGMLMSSLAMAGEPCIDARPSKKSGIGDAECGYAVRWIGTELVAAVNGADGMSPNPGTP